MVYIKEKRKMTFEEFKKMTYHTRLYIRIPYSSSVIDKVAMMTKGKLDNKKVDSALKTVYESENYMNR